MEFKAEYVPERRGHFPEKWIAGMKLENEIVWKNPNEKDFIVGKVGERFDGPLFHQYPDVKAHGHVGLREFHHRTFSFPSIINAEGNEIFLSAKGVGVHHDLEVESAGNPMRGDEGYLGLYDLDSAQYDKDHALLLESFDCRIAKPVAIIKLNELPSWARNEGTQVNSIAELKKLGVLKPDFDPVVYIRSAISDTRVEDICNVKNVNSLNPHNIEKIKKEIDRIAGALAGEVGKKMNPKEYVEWFVQTAATSLGKLHKNGYVHRYIHAGNMTIAGELIDFDSVEKAEYEEDENLKDLTKLDKDGNPTSKKGKEFARDIEQSEEGDVVELGILNICRKMAETVVQLYPEAFGIKKNEATMLIFEEYFPEIDKMFWENYVRECPENKYLESTQIYVNLT